MSIEHSDIRKSPTGEEIAAIPNGTLPERKPLGQRLPPHLIDRLYQDIGSATMCWENINAAGIFKSEQAAKIAEALGHAIADELDARDLVIKPYLANAAFSIERVIARVRERSGAEPAQLDAEITTGASSI